MHLFLEHSWRERAAKPLMVPITVQLQNMALLIRVDQRHEDEENDVVFLLVNPIL